MARINKQTFFMLDGHCKGRSLSKSVEQELNKMAEGVAVGRRQFDGGATHQDNEDDVRGLWRQTSPTLICEETEG